jgi:hypothetical protein
MGWKREWMFLNLHNLAQSLVTAFVAVSKPSEYGVNSYWGYIATTRWNRGEH